MADTSIYTDPTNMTKDNIQLLIWNGTKWVELSNGLTINQINANIGAIQDAVAEAQKGISTAEANSENAVEKADNAITQSTANTADITKISSDLDTTKDNLQSVSDEAAKNGNDIKDIQSDNTQIRSDLANTQGDVSQLQQTATTMQSNIKDNTDNITSVTQTASGLSADMKDAQGDITTLKATTTGLQTAVDNKADSSTVTQLATLVDSKVNTSDYNSEITQLADDINLRVKADDLISQINEQAGGDTLIQVSSGKGKLYLDASSVVFGGTAFITSAMISSLNADDITTGTMTAGAINLGNGTFSVDNAGNLIATSANITGDITGSNISGSTITGSIIQGAEITTNADDYGYSIGLEGTRIYNNNNSISFSANQMAQNSGMTLDSSYGINVVAESGSIMLSATTVDISNNLNIHGYSYYNSSNEGIYSDQDKRLSLFAGSAYVHVGDDGSGYFRSPPTYGRTTSGGANVYVATNGIIARSTSATKYKLAIGEINDISTQAHSFLGVKPKRWFDKAETEKFSDILTNGLTDTIDTPKINPYVGFIAEDLQTAGLDRFIEYGADGQIEGIQYDRLPVLHHQLLKEAYDTIDELETKLNLLIENNNLK